MLQVRDLSVEVGGRTTLAAASFSLRAGDKVGLVGRNGAGKTSLLKVLAGQAEPAGGMVVRPRGLGYLPQDPAPRGAGVHATGLSHVLSGRGLDEAAVRLEKLRLRMEEDPSEGNVRKFTNAEDRFRHDGGYAAEAEAKRIAAGVGLPTDRLDLPLPALSGGERRRVELARILFAGTDALLLDEPTNHLDVDAKHWLMGFLRAYPGALLVVSHDLQLLDRSITRILHLDAPPPANRAEQHEPAQLVEYKGTYSQYREAHARDEERQARLAARQQQEMARLKSLADSMRGQTEKRARIAKTLDRRVERMAADAITGPRGERTLRVRLPEPPRSGTTVLEAEGLTKGFGGAPVFEDVTFSIGRGERLLVMGLNGAGKSTLVKILMGTITPDAGTFRLGHHVSAGYYAQEHESIVAGRTPIDHVRAAAPLPDAQVRGILGMFGLHGDTQQQDASTLSGGEKTKLALAALCAGAHNLLLLDEPTNNLDPPSRVAIGAALQAWTGTMILVSHDTEFVQELAPDRVLLMPDGELDHWSDDLLDLVALA